MNKVVISVLTVVLVISVVINVYFLTGKGIQIDKSITTHSESFSTSMSGAMIVNGQFYEGNTFETKTAYFDTEDEKNIFMKMLPPFSWLWAKEYFSILKNKWVVDYPYFYKEETKKVNK